jgi:ornithine cyclodeaminase/alanine dehydrogenase-like protein (mu-crystallin family)
MNSVKEVVNEADVIILTTRSSEPVIFREWIKKGIHIVSVGKKSIDEHELDPAIPPIHWSSSLRTPKSISWKAAP